MNHTAKSEAASLPGAQTYILLQGIGHHSTMDWHREVKKLQRMFMAVENMARQHVN